MLLIPFLCVDNSNGCLSVEAELQFRNCKVDYGNLQVKARYIRGDFEDAAGLLDLYGDARTIPPSVTFPSRVVPISLQIFATPSKRKMLQYGHSEIEVNGAVQILFGLKTDEEQVIIKFFSYPHLLQKDKFLLIRFSTSQRGKIGQVEDQRCVCIIYSKSVISGESLGGHMRVHLAQIGGSKTSGIKMECGDDDELNESCINQANGFIISDEQLIGEEYGGGDQHNNRYILRQNPAKFWRVSEHKHTLLAKTVNACRECGREFTFLRALSGHMRRHAIKRNKEVHLCKEWGRRFEAMRAMFGHTKSHK